MLKKETRNKYECKKKTNNFQQKAEGSKRLIYEGINRLEIQIQTNKQIKIWRKQEL